MLTKTGRALLACGVLSTGVAVVGVTEASASCGCYTAAQIASACQGKPARFVTVDASRGLYVLRCQNASRQGWLYSISYEDMARPGAKSCDVAQMGRGGENPRQYVTISKSQHAGCLAVLNDAATRVNAVRQP